MVRSGIDDRVYSNMKAGLDNYYKEEQKEMTQAWDTVQTRLGCCGMYNASDWLDTIPASCYAGGTLYVEGCYHTVCGIIASNITILTGRHHIHFLLVTNCAYSFSKNICVIRLKTLFLPN